MIPNDMRARLIVLSAKQGKKGYSELICKAVEEYLDKEDNKKKLLNKVLKLEGSLTEEEANAAEKRIKEFWDRWSL